jgi:peptidoglycan/LPS O-acetylase OafA/YrhL
MAAMVLLRHAIQDNGGRLAASDVVSFALHRAARMMPVYTAVMAVYVYIVPMLSTGPFWWNIAVTTGKWWACLSFALIADLLTIRGMCMPSSLLACGIQSAVRRGGGQTSCL